MAKELPFYKMFPKDFDTNEKVRMLDCREAGVYLFALNHAWINDGLPGNDDDIGRVLKIPVRDFRESWPAVKRCFFVAEDGRLRNARQEEERKKAQEKSEKATNAVGQRKDRSGSVKRTLYERKSNEDIRASDYEDVFKEPDKTEESGFDLSDWFEEIYTRHPKKKDRGLAAQYLSELPVADPKFRAEFDRVHRLWCVEWSVDRAQFITPLAQWILDQGWKYPPDSHKKSATPITKNCPKCHMLPCYCAEIEAEKQAAREKKAS